MHQLLFLISVLTLSWLSMMAFHELGHVLGAMFTGGTVQRVVLHPLKISQTDVSPNPMPGVVVWLGPVIGCLIPMLISLSVPKREVGLSNLAWFLTGFCIIANGAYIGFGSINAVGDCGVMLASGSPIWTLFAFAGLTIPLGMYIWHRLGSPAEFLADSSLVNRSMTYLLFSAVVVVVTAELWFSVR